MKASTCCKCHTMDHVAHICFKRSVLIGVRNRPTCLITGLSAGGRRGERIHFMQEKYWISPYLHKYLCTGVFFLQG